MSRVAWSALRPMVWPPLASAASEPEFFDDFLQPDLDALRASGWVLREGAGHPGQPGSRFAASQLSLQHGELRLTLSTDGSPQRSLQPQLCSPRKFLVGTTSARVRLRDGSGPRDPLVQAFFLGGPLRQDYDPEFSEVDFEYLPHGGWGDPATRLYGVSWQTVRLSPWQAYNSAAQAPGSHDGWQVLTLQVDAGRVRHYVNGKLMHESGGRNVPVRPMAISFSHWLAAGAEVGEARTHAFEVDWVLHEAGRLLTPAAMQSRVAQLRRQGVTQRDSVPDAGLSSECDL